jgi:dsRNA-specific ribonuclease
VVAGELGSARGEGINRRAAEQAAAHNLLELLRACSSPSMSAEGEQEPYV